MGNLIGKAVALNGDEIQVTFTTDEFEDGALPEIVNIVTQMDGSAGEYSPMKITTASISFLVDGASLMSLCVSEQPVAVLVENTGQGSILFRGYVVPNSYNQALSGINDTITIECVDCLGYAKYVHYVQWDANTGFDFLAIDQVISRCFFLCGARGKIMLPNTIQVWRGNDRIDLTRISLSETYFFESIYPDQLTKDYEPQAMSCEQILTMFAESVRMTWVSDGNDVYLRDELGASVGDVSYWDVGTQQQVTHPVLHQIEEKSFATPACNVSGLARISMTEVEYDRVEQVDILQNPFDTNYLHVDGEMEEHYIYGGDPNRRRLAVPLKSDLYDTYYPSRIPEGVPRRFSQFVAWLDDEAITPSESGDHTFIPRGWGVGDWTTALKLYSPESLDGQEIFLQRKVQFTTPAMGLPAGVLARRELCINAQVVATSDIYDWLCPNDEKPVQWQLQVSLTANGLYYDPSTNGYTDEKRQFVLHVTADGRTWFSRGSSPSEDATGIPLPVCGQIIFTIYSNTRSNAWSIGWLTRLELTLKSSIYGLTTDALRQPIVRVGSWRRNSVQRLTPPFHFHYRMPSRPLYVPLPGDGEYRGEPELLLNVAGEGLTLAEYAHKLANMGDRISYEVTLLNDDTRHSPMDAYMVSQLWSGRKIVDGYMQDVLKNEITLTLI